MFTKEVISINGSGIECFDVCVWLCPPWTAVAVPRPRKTVTAVSQPGYGYLESSHSPDTH